jgi:hypothetical protein
MKDGVTGVYMREGTASRVIAADRPYGEFYDFYSVSPETLDTTLYTSNQHATCTWRSAIWTLRIQI